ncbi:MAG TPA: hypothetical protein VF592_05815 [Sphingomonas sp.]|uniref:hypothetical protein n=1 Tax=Sphingomonas sp. TaxID=28214 RepID=UPI002ED9AAB2
MTVHLHQWEGATALPLDVLLSAVPALPREALARLTARLIERLDELDPDPDAEPEEDCCPAGDDDIRDGPMPGRTWDQIASDEHEDAEADDPAPAGATKSREAHRRRIQRTRCDPIHGRPRWNTGRRTIDRWELREDQTTSAQA